jgi:hypothetical protein
MAYDGFVCAFRQTLAWRYELRLWSALLFLWLLGVIGWCAFGVVEEADYLAELLGEPLRTLVLTLSIVIIEVVLIGAVALGGHSAPTLGRDTMFAVLMIILNGAVGLCLLLGGLRHHEQAYNLQGAVAYLAVIIPLSVIALILPNFTQAVPAGSLKLGQAASFSLFTVLLYGIFLAIQTGRHRKFFVEPKSRGNAFETPPGISSSRGAGTGEVAWHMFLLVITMLPIVVLAKSLAKLLDHGIEVPRRPRSVGGSAHRADHLCARSDQRATRSPRKSAAAIDQSVPRGVRVHDRPNGSRDTRDRDRDGKANDPWSGSDRHDPSASNAVCSAHLLFLDLAQLFSRERFIWYFFSSITS